MFIKLTRLDNSPIWLNASFVVTVEPRKGGGSIVVPIGDGLDYDVRETPEVVLGLLSGAPVPAVVPVQTRDALTQTPDDVSPEPERPDPEPQPVASPEIPAEPVAEPEAKPKTVRKTRARTTKVKSTKTAAKETAAEGDAADEKPKPARKTRTTKAKAPKKPPLPLDDAQLERLKRMMPRSIRKLTNTLAAQFRIEDGETAVQALVENGVISLDKDHVIWLP